MTLKVQNPDTNEEIEVYTAEEIADRDAKIADLSKKLEDRGNDFSQMSKKLEKVDEFGKQIETLQSTLAEKEKAERENAKASALGKFHGGKVDAKEQLESSYAKLAGMPENTPEEIAARANEAAKLAGYLTDGRNPLYTPFSGEAPSPRGVSESAQAKEEEFYKSERGQAALKAMGFVPDAK